ncbi:hypothetical protein ACRQV7_03225 [Caproiciproducens sp. R2]|uniref:hypothetical protein n=1 Tax=Caproiciproducens sp. R2 TaxID=3435187 RepID=UPI004034A765
MTSNFSINNMNGISNKDEVRFGINNMNALTDRNDISLRYDNENGVSELDSVIYHINNMNGISFISAHSSPALTLFRILSSVAKGDSCRRRLQPAEAK